MTNKETFETNYLRFIKFVIPLAEKARQQGLLSLSDDINQEMADERDIFHYGLRFAVDGTAPGIIERILSNMIQEDKDHYSRQFKLIQMVAVMGIQEGMGHEILHSVLNSYTDISIREEKIRLKELPDPS